MRSGDHLMNDVTPSAATPATAVITVRLRAGAAAAFSAWQAKASLAAAAFPGFISAETIPERTGVAWSVVHCFRSTADVDAWRASAAYRDLLSDARGLVDPGDAFALREDLPEASATEGAVSEIVTTLVKPGKEREYQAWAERIHLAEAQFPGYRGGFLQPPLSQQQPEWTTLVRFATPEQLDAWLNSAQRASLLREHAALVESWDHRRAPSSFAGWFPEGATVNAPPAWKQSMLVILVLFPIVMLELRFLDPLLGKLNLAGSTFIGNVISVSLLAWPFMPLVIGRMTWWIAPRKDAPAWTNAAGVGLVLALYAAEIVLLSRLA